MCYSERQCDHGRCFNHSPDWERVGEPIFQPNPVHFLNITTFFTKKCCDMRMQRVKKVVRRKCKKCGAEEWEVISYLTALCSCCGRTELVLTVKQQARTRVSQLSLTTGFIFAKLKKGFLINKELFNFSLLRNQIHSVMCCFLGFD